jgi:phosphocarrier protein HPr
VTTAHVTISNALGLHARAAARFVGLASRFRSQIQVAHHTRTVEGKSILGLLLLAAACGSTITIACDGDDEAAAVDALVGLVERGFEEL